MCERSLALRALVNARLTAAAEEIFALVERTIAEYEEELCRSKEENQRNQQLLDSVLSPQVSGHTTADVQIKTEMSEDEAGPALDPLSAAGHAQRSQTTAGQTEPDCDDWSRDWEPRPGVSSQLTDLDDEDFNNQVQNLSTEMFRATSHGASHGASPAACEDEAKVKHECPVCNKKLGRKQELKRHMLLHTGEKPFSCPVCHKRFIQKSNLKSHIVTHLDTVDTIIRHQKPSETSRDEAEGEEWRDTKPQDKLLERLCDAENEDDWTGAMEAAGSSSTRRADDDDEEEEEEEPGETNSLERISFLLNRALNESKERKLTEYKCPICDKVFGRMENLRRHVLVHTGEKAFSCPVCCKQFTLKQHLKLHMVLHTRDKQFNCSVCAKTFIRKDNLRSHMRIHSAERPFGCSDCAARFFSDQDLERHKAVHGAERPFVCSICNAGFLTRRHLTRHEKIHKKDQKSQGDLCVHVPL
ncbi:uncharacterized protein [Eucyclogobius newberryi]|uniref:uncharacterized protein isoform X2 n=1 Tax=Eucyclogobius newberryi TaxID=166745 RepID=UPI003B5BAFA2